jgi:hypothetical protein
MEHVVGECHQSLLAVAYVAAHDFLGVLRVAGEDGVDDVAVFVERVPAEGMIGGELAVPQLQAECEDVHVRAELDQARIVRREQDRLVQVGRGVDLPSGADRDRLGLHALYGFGAGTGS